MTRLFRGLFKLLIKVGLPLFFITCPVLAPSLCLLAVIIVLLVLGITMMRALDWLFHGCPSTE